MKYPIYNLPARLIIATIDSLLRFLFPAKPSTSFLPKKILISNLAHLGDVILTTSLLPVLKKAYPEAQIGMLIGTWSQCVIKHQVDYVHCLDHWKHTKKFLRYLKMRRRVLKELRAIHYDLAIDCNFHFPNAAPLLWQAKIPKRVGFSTAGFSPLLTNAFAWNPKENRSAVEAFFSLLPELQSFKSILRPTLAVSSKKRLDYIVLHVGTLGKHKLWPKEKWRALAMKLLQKGECLYFTGKGTFERALVSEITQGLDVINLCDQQTWDQFATTIQQAKFLVSVDSCAGHVAAAVKTPGFILSTGMHPTDLWKPYSLDIQGLTRYMSCGPCLRGCKAMGCIKNLSVDFVISKIVSDGKLDRRERDNVHLPFRSTE